MDLSCKTEYALQALVELARQWHRREPLQIRHIAQQQQIPDRYLEQLLATLRRTGLVKSQRGIKGGYILGREPWQISLLEIVLALEGPSPNGTDRPSNLETIAINDIWQEARSASYGILQGYTLQDLCDRCERRKQLDCMYYI